MKSLLLTLGLVACTTLAKPANSGALRLELRPGASAWDSEPRDHFGVGDEVTLRIRLPVDPYTSAPLTVSQYRVRIEGPPRRDRTWPVLLDQRITLDPPHVFRATEIPVLYWPFVISEDMAQAESRVAVHVTISDLGLDGTIQLSVSPR